MSTGTRDEPSLRPLDEDEHSGSEFSRVLDEITKRFDRLDWVEVAATVVLSVAVLVTAWSAYQATRWSGVQSINASQYSAHLIESSEVSTLIETQLQLDSQAISAWLVVAVDDNQAGMQSLEERFDETLRPAFDAWTAGSTSGELPPGLPQDLPEYEEGFEELLEVKSFHSANAVGATERAAEANRTADKFVLITVVMASVMFFAGIGAKLRGRNTRISMLVIAGILCMGAIAAVLSLPHQPVEF